MITICYIVTRQSLIVTYYVEENRIELSLHSHPGKKPDKLAIVWVFSIILSLNISLFSNKRKIYWAQKPTSATFLQPLYKYDVTKMV